MATVALIGFSTSGKSTILKHFEDILGDSIDRIDTDKEISKEKYGEHIYLLYSKLSDPTLPSNQSQKATDEVEKLEKEKLVKLLDTANKPRLIAFGPGAVLRTPNWTEFLDRVKPKVFYLRLSAAEALVGLRKRRERHIKAGLEGLPAFGSWDNGIATEFDQKSQCWIPIEDEGSLLRKIKENMNGYLKKYEDAAINGETISVAVFR